MKIRILIAFLFFSAVTKAQSKTSDLFQTIQEEIRTLTVDTSSVPEDRLTREIRRMRQAKGGFNINEAILYKIAEDKSKGDINPGQALKMEQFFTTGNGKKWLDNAVIWIHRKQFTLAEIKKIRKFYNSAAGQKMGGKFPLIMVQCLKAAETIGGTLKTAGQ